MIEIFTADGITIGLYDRVGDNAVYFAHADDYEFSLGMVYLRRGEYRCTCHASEDVRKCTSRQEVIDFYVGILANLKKETT